MSQQLQPYTLAIDIGTNSLGWAVLRGNGDSIDGIIDAGVRIFQAGMEKLDQAKAESRNNKRREARQMRRQTWRRRLRCHNTLILLQKAGLLPEGAHTPMTGALAEVMRKNPYEMRAQALHHKLELFEIGRAIYHLAQRRGFLSNRKSVAKQREEDEKEKQKGKAKKKRDVLGEIRRTGEEYKQKEFRTFGEYLFSLDPHERRLRDRYTSRHWYEEEFDAIWEAQSKHWPEVLTPELKGSIQHYRPNKKMTQEKKRSIKEKGGLAHAIFYQRPLKNQKFLIGKCTFFPKKRRASWALLDAQRFRYLQDINNMLVLTNGYEARKLTEEERQLVIHLAERGDKEKITFASVRKALPKGAKLNLEAADRKDFKGNVTAIRVRAIFGERWDSFSREDQNRVVQDVMCTEKAETLEKRGREVWGLDDDKAHQFGELQLDGDYCSLSLHAIEKLLPHLEKGLTYREAEDKAREEGVLPPAGDAVLNRLPPVKEFGMVRNPIVERSLTELRHLVNALIAKHGKPERIRIELARDLKQSAKERERRYKKMGQDKKVNEMAAKKILDATGDRHPSADALLRVKLWLECDGWCPYTEEKISIHDLLGPHPKYDIEHIIPFSRSMENGFHNLTLCEAQENRTRKHSNTPFEAYAGSDPKKYGEILERVKKFKNPEKLRRFMMKEIGEEITDDFCSNQLNDTRYASRLARDYLAQLYGGEWRSHIQVSAGGVTGYLRSAWRLNGILNDGNIKQRNDHRHHAVDAITIGLSSPRWVRTLAEISKRDEFRYRPGQFRDVPEPWPGFLTEARAKILSIVVSHRVGKRVRGQLHKDTLYGVIRIRHADKKLKKEIVLRKPIESLSEPEINSGNPPDPTQCGVVRRNPYCGFCKSLIVDRAVCGAVRKAFRECPDHKTFKARMEEPANHPVNVSLSGKATPIHRLRVIQQATPEPLGHGLHQRNVLLANNHHVEIFASKDKRGREVWKERTITLLDAMGRRKAGLPIIANQDEDGNKLVFSLAKKETVELEWNGQRQVCTVQSISYGDYEFRLLNDARLDKDVKAANERIRIRSMSRLKELGCRKLVITIDGRVRNARD